jgi:phenylalanine ammonia-lyase
MPLSYIAGAIEGSPDVFVTVEDHCGSGQSRVTTAFDALKELGIPARAMGPKEGLTVVNGTSSSAGLASLVIHEALQLGVLVQSLAGVAVEALLGNSESFHPFVSAVRPHVGQVEVASVVLSLLQGSKLATNLGDSKDRKKVGLVQDRYALRSTPQWIGPQLEDMLLAYQQITTELNSTCDNPIIDTASRDVYYGCNFQAASVTSAMEKVRIALQMLGKLVFSQATEIIEPHLNNGLPTNLAPDDTNISFTMKGVDTNMAAYMAELAYLSHPISSHIQAAEMHNQSVNSMALASSRFSMQAVEILSIMCACHLYVACQALDLRVLHLTFMVSAVQVLQQLTTEHLPPFESAEAQSKLNAALETRFRSTWATTNTHSPAERCELTVDSTVTVVVDLCSNTTTAKQLYAWKTASIASLSTLFEDTKDAFVATSPTSQYLGKGSKALYETVRTTLRVPFHQGLRDYPTSWSQSIGMGGSDKKTIGSHISTIYEAIRRGDVVGPIFGVLNG